MITLGDATVATGVPFALVLGLRRLWKTSNGVWRPYLRGAATAFVALLFETFLSDYFSSFASGEYGSGIEAFLFIALPEELVKTALIYMIVLEWSKAGFREVGILSAAVGAGFAAAENFLYLAQLGSVVIIQRLLTATPFHTFVAIVVAKLIFVGVQRRRAEFVTLALFVGTVLHGTYDYLILSPYGDKERFVFALALTSSLALNLLRQEKSS
ncbi:MAG TPA: PrsW family glutamic-type intramembrane protease [Stellaceae bacterium]|nr:PrsW family glutamic-type intramembrane protease [Stellaceae bacterium]